MRKLTTSLLYIFIFVAFGCNASSGVRTPEQKTLSSTQEAESGGSPIIPTLREVGSRGFFVLDGPFAEFDPTHPSVEIWTPDGDANAPAMVYAHGGAGYREDDRARVAMFRRNGFATISFDSYVMNGFDDWNFVTRRIANSGKQNMIWGVFKGAVDYAATNDDWDNRNIFLYGGSNGGRVVLYAGSKIENENIRGIIAEAPAGSGFALGDYTIPTIIPFGALDTWAGKSDTDYVWKRTYPNSPISIEDWVNAQQAKGRPVNFIFYEGAGHLLFEGALELVTVRRGDAIAFTAYRGAAEGVLEQYEKDVMSFVTGKLVQKEMSQSD
jgi:dienelactone hydrolase